MFFKIIRAETRKSSDTTKKDEVTEASPPINAAFYLYSKPLYTSQILCSTRRQEFYFAYVRVCVKTEPLLRIEQRIVLVVDGM